MIAKHVSRALLYAVLLVAALFFLAPLYVMLSTSLKDAEQIRSGNLLSFPASLNLEAWRLAWSAACTGVDCRGLILIRFQRDRCYPVEACQGLHFEGIQFKRQ
jgi:glucose/mannose transport system permease protein